MTKIGKNFYDLEGQLEEAQKPNIIERPVKIVKVSVQKLKGELPKKEEEKNVAQRPKEEPKKNVSPARKPDEKPSSSQKPQKVVPPKREKEQKVGVNLTKPVGGKKVVE